jgi:hypothetical protein
MVMLNQIYPWMKLILIDIDALQAQQLLTKCNRSNAHYQRLLIISPWILLKWKTETGGKELVIRTKEKDTTGLNKKLGKILFEV